jgi:PAS domain S-box-containing protein
MKKFSVDINNSNETEELLLRYKLLAEHSRDIILLVRRDDGRILEANDAATNTYGYDQEELLGLTIKELRAPETVGLVDPQMAEADSHGILFETIHCRRDGSTFPVEVSSQGATIGGMRTLVSVIRDITERKRTEEDLRASEEKFSTMFQTVPIAIALATLPDGALHNVNPAWLGLTGFTRKEEVIGKTSLELGLIADAAQRQSILNEFRQNGFVRNVELTFCTRKSVLRTVLVNLNRVEIGGCAFILSTMEEITERKRAEEVLQKVNENLEMLVRERTAELLTAMDTLSGEISERKHAEEQLLRSEERYRKVVEDQTEIICRFKADGTLTFVNDVYCRVFGRTCDGFLGSKWHPKAFPDDVPVIEEQLGKLSPSNPVVVIENRIYSGSGEIRWMQFVNRGFFNEEGRLIETQAVGRDITDRKQVQEKLQQSLETVNTANSNMNRLLRTIAHEFRTPLGLLTGSTDILDRYWDRLTSEKRLEQNEQIRNATHQIANLVNSVISFQLTGTDRPGIPPLLQDIGGICRSIATEVETVWGGGHEFIVSIAADCGSALLDEILFRRVLQNLLSNAFRYTPPNGTVSLLVRRDRSMLVLEITDTGIGIPEEDQELIFEAFYRSRNVEERRGLGLGLSIVREALSQMGGTITVTSSTGDGTTMRVEIPVVDPE